jgi:hypothetical protein
MTTRGLGYRSISTQPTLTFHRFMASVFFTYRRETNFIPLSWLRDQWKARNNLLQCTVLAHDHKKLKGIDIKSPRNYL